MRWWLEVRAFWLGFIEGAGEVGRHWPGDFDLNETYDQGRSLRRWLAGME